MSRRQIADMAPSSRYDHHIYKLIYEIPSIFCGLLSH
uniref:Uncharacterized protein n=1 Tax=Arundo donax TaxID=35708 RepID=A0A0A9BW49_ARUDO